MNNTKKNKQKEGEKKRLAKALKQNILKRKKQQQSRQNARVTESRSDRCTVPKYDGMTQDSGALVTYEFIRL